MMIRQKTDIETREIKTLNLSGFKGVDFSSSPLKASSKRAVNSENMIYEGNIRKRNGWKEVAQVTGKINGMYPYLDGVETKYLVYAAKVFYSLAFTTTGYGFLASSVVLTSIDAALLTDTPVQFFSQSGRIFITGCGDFLVWHKVSNVWTLERVFDNAISYIPTTTISLDYTGYSGTSVTSAFERPNLMNQWRKNSARGVVGSNTETPVVERTYQLDGSVTISTSSATTEQAYVTIVFLDGTVQTLALIGFYDSVSGHLALKESSGSATIYGYIHSDGVMTLETVTEPPTTDDNITVQFKGYNGSEYASGNTSAHIQGAAFGTLYGVDGITSQLFLAGADITTTLSIKNRDYFSYPLDFTYFPDNNYRDVGNSAITGYARIGDGTLMIFKAKTYGEASVFVRSGTYVANSTTLENDTVYSEKAGYAGSYLTARRSVENLSGDTLYLTSTGLKGIVLGENVTTDERFARERSKFIDTQLVGHDLTTAIGIVHKNKYYLAVEGVCYVCDARYAEQEGDTFNYEWFYWTNIGTPTNYVTCWYEDEEDLYFGTLNGNICKFDDEFTDRSITMIASGNLTVHAADDHVLYNSSLTFTEGDRIRFEDEYIHQVLFNPYDLTYSDSKFRVKVNQCLYTAVTLATNRITLTAHGFGAAGTHIDIYYHQTTGTAIGGLTLDTKYNVEVIDADTIQFTEDLTSQGTGTHEFLSATAMNLLWLEEDQAFRVVAEDSESTYETFYIHDIDLGEMSFKLKDSVDADHTLTDISAAGTILVLSIIVGEDLYIDTVDTTDHEFTLRRYGSAETMYLTYYNFEGTPYYDETNETAVVAMVTSAEDINATWYTPVFDLGSNVYSKTLLSITLSAEPVEKGQILFGFETRRKVGSGEANGLTTFSFDDVDFDDFAFDTEFTTSCTKRVKERGFNFIMFRFVSDNAYACEINDFTARYMFSSMNKGVR